MFLDLTDAQRALSDDLCAYFSTLITPAERAAMLTQRHGSVYREVVRRMGRDGWLGVGWPVEYGGHGLGQIEQLASCTSPSATPSQAQAPTWHRCAPGQYSTATTMWSTGRKSSRQAGTMPITSGLPAVPIRMRPGTGACRS